MSRAITVTSLDDDVSPAAVMLDFGSKTIIAEYAGTWLYRMAGTPHLPRGSLGETRRAVYGASKADDWAVSASVRRVIDWIDED